MKTWYLLLFVSFFRGHTLIGQHQTDTYRPELLIPFNDHDQWGWSDTLGNIMIQPKYDEVGFFYKQADGKYKANTKLKGRTNYFIFGSGLIVPEHASFIRRYTPDSSSKSLVIIKENQKYGLYDPDTKRMIISPKYETYDLSGNTALFFRKKKKKGYYYSYDHDEKRLEKTTITNIDDWQKGYEYETFFQDKNGYWYRYIDRIFVSIDLKKENWKRGDEEIYLEEIDYEDDGDRDEFSKTYDITDTTKTIVRSTLDFSDFSFISENYGYQKLFVTEGSQGIGIISDTEKEIIPIAYDSLKMITAYSRLRYRGAVFYKEGLAGVKLFFTHYSAIAPKYQDISTSIITLKVSKTWSFAVYSVRFRERSLYVGENGTEYFNFD